MNIDVVTTIITVLLGQGVLRYILEFILQKPQRKQSELQSIIDNLHKDNETLRKEALDSDAQHKIELSDLRTEIDPIRTRYKELALKDAEREIAMMTLRSQVANGIQRQQALQLEKDKCERDSRELETKYQSLMQTFRDEITNSKTVNHT
jgi:hypothetical protein